MPYSGFSILELLAAEKALRLAWEEAPKRYHCHEIDFNEANEDGISSALVNVFDDILKVNADWLSDLAVVFYPLPIYNSQYGPVDYLGQPLTVKPDLTFRKAYSNPGISQLNASLFVEAKLVEQGKTMSKYCGDGLIRFVEGKYAWAMPQAMMVGYRRNTKQRLPNTLATYFARSGKREEYHLLRGPVPFPPSRYRECSYLTEHARPWEYPKTGASPGSITVVHLWLSV